MNLFIAASSMFALAVPMLVGAAELPPLTTVPTVDIDRYAGVWYEIARNPNWFERKCASDVSAAYRLLPSGVVEVLNTCRQKDGSLEEARGIARPVTTNDFTRLEVRFAPGFLSFLPFVWGDYWVIELAPDYSYALIGEPKREYLWVLARSPKMNDAALQRLLDAAATHGYDPTRVVRTYQTNTK